MFVVIKRALVTGASSVKSTRIPTRYREKEGRDDA